METKQNIQKILKSELKHSNITSYRRNRLLAINYYLMGKDNQSIAETIDISIRSVQRYIKEFNEEGINGLNQKQKPGGTRVLSDDQVLKIKSDLRVPPSNFNLVAATWSPTILARYIRKKYNVNLSRETCRIMIRDHSSDADPGDKKIKKTPFIATEEFNDHLQELAKVPETEIWIVGQVCVGLRAIYKRKSNSKIPDQAVVICAKRYLNDGQFCEWLRSYHKKKQMLDMLNRISKNKTNDKVVIFLPKSSINQYIVNRLKPKKDIVIDFLPTGVSTQAFLTPLRDNILKAAKLPTKNIPNLQLGKGKENAIIKYIQKISIE